MQPAQPTYPAQAAGYGPQPHAPAQAAAPGGKRSGLALAGAAIAAVGIIAGLALLFTAGSTREATIERYARAGVGCTTTLQFDRTGTFTFYVETRGSLPSLGGDCAGGGASYQHAGPAPSVSLTLVDAAGTGVPLNPASGPSYDEGAYAGVGTFTAQIASEGSYQLTVASDAVDVAVAVGGDPDADASTQQTMGIVLAVVGGLLGGLLVVLGMRRKPPTAAAPPSPSWPAQGGVPGWQPAASAPQFPGQQYPGQQYPGQQASPAPPPAPPWGAPPQH